MTPGTLLFAPRFRFHDGGQSPRILVVLGTLQGITLIVKLMECVLRSDDISPRQMKIIKAALACFESSASEDE